MSKPSPASFETQIEVDVGTAMAEHGPSLADVAAFETAFAAWLACVAAACGTDPAADPDAIDAALNAFEDGTSAADYALQLQARPGGAALDDRLAAIHRTLAVS